MKTLKIIVILQALIIVIISCNNTTNKQNVVQVNKTSSFKVWGNCDMCKETIENSLKVNGIAKANWNEDTKLIEVGFDSTLISLDNIQKNIATVGYDNEAYKGSEEAYNNLQECCKYDRK